MADDEVEQEQEGEDQDTEDTITVTVKTGDHAGASVEFDKNFGTSLGDATTRYGEAVVFSLYHRQAVIACQARVRAALSKGMPKPEAIALGQSYVPGVAVRVARPKQNPVDALAQQVIEKKITMEELMEMIQARLLEKGEGA